MMQTPLDLYQRRLKNGALHADPVQKNAVDSLNALHEVLIAESKVPPLTLFQKITGLGAEDNIPAPKGIYIYGGVGRGKSMLMNLFFDSLPEEIKKRRVHFHEFMIEVHDYIHTHRSDENTRTGVDEALPSLAGLIAARAHVLCFDEFHVTDITDAMILGRLFKILFEQGVVVVATSNWEPDRLYEGGLQRERFLPFIELLKAEMDVLHLDSPHDYRAQTIPIEGTYFSPLGRRTRQAMERVFKALSTGEKPKVEILEVKGRNLKVLHASGVARFTFAELCEQPHGAEDYLTIAQACHTVFIENIPKMGYDRRNEVKRLINLIDALYEARTRVIISAAAPPEKLYYGHDHEFEFQRTISRLNEMRGEGWP